MHRPGCSGFDLKKTLEMDPEFLNTDGEHVHDDSVTTMSIVRPGEVHGALINEWVSEILKDFGASIFRMKGVLAISGAEKKFVYQAVHMIFDGSFDEDEEWGEDEPKVNRLVFIGKNLDKEKLTSGFEGCLDIPANDAKIMAMMQVKLAQRQVSSFVQAAQRDDVPALKRLVAAGFDPNQGNGIGQTALHVACMWGNYKSVEVLTSAGANPDQLNQFGVSPLHALTRMDKGEMHGLIECAKIMRQVGANLALPDPDGKAAWEYAVAKDEELARILNPASP